jgi:hypothetical protein
MIRRLKKDVLQQSVDPEPVVETMINDGGEGRGRMIDEDSLCSRNVAWKTINFDR